MKKVFFALLHVTVWFCTVHADRINLEAYAGSFDSIPLGMVAFRPTGGPALKENLPWEIIADDLDFSGRFCVTRSTKIDSSLFRTNNIGLFIDGEYTVNGDNVSLECYIREATTLKLLAGKNFSGDVRQVRSMAHRYANQVFDMLLGEQGFFESKIVYVTDKGSSKHLYIMDYDGYFPKKITSQGEVNIFPAFLDSSTIIWTSFLRGKPDIYTGSISTGASSILIFSRYVQTSPAATMVLDKIAYASSKNGNLDIYTCDRGGKNHKQLTFNRSIDTSPCWSPNGYQIAFTSDRTGTPQVYIMDGDGANTRRLTYEGSYYDSPAWSPKGDKIAFSSLREYKFDVWAVNPDGSSLTRITSMPGNNEYPTWSPDGSHIAFVSTRGGKSDIYCIRPDGTGLKQITKSGNAKMPDWSKF